MRRSTLIFLPAENYISFPQCLQKWLTSIKYLLSCRLNYVNVQINKHANLEKLITVTYRKTPVRTLFRNELLSELQHQPV
jgi:hypothetical protein